MALNMTQEVASSRDNSPYIVFLSVCSQIKHKSCHSPAFLNSPYKPTGALCSPVIHHNSLTSRNVRISGKKLQFAYLLYVAVAWIRAAVILD